MVNVNEMDVPKSTSGFLKLEEGTAKIRILSTDFIEGYEDRDTIDGKPKSFLYPKDECPEVAKSKDGFVYLWACPVWNYETKSVQILKIKSKQIMNKIKTLCADEDWGPELDYDLKITKTGVKKETKYEVVPANKGDVTDDIANAYVEADIVLEKMFQGLDPFNK